MLKGIVEQQLFWGKDAVRKSCLQIVVRNSCLEIVAVIVETVRNIAQKQLLWETVVAVKNSSSEKKNSCYDK